MATRVLTEKILYDLVRSKGCSLSISGPPYLCLCMKRVKDKEFYPYNCGSGSWHITASITTDYLILEEGNMTPF